MQTDESGRIINIKAHWDILSDVNKNINKQIRYKEDMELYRKPEFWTIANGFGDCEDYALTKRKILVQNHGFPANALPIATCWVENNGGYHAVLVCRTTDADYVLDNRYTRVMKWSDMPYKFHLIQVFGENRWREISNGSKEQRRSPS